MKHWPTAGEVRRHERMRCYNTPVLSGRCTSGGRQRPSYARPARRTPHSTGGPAMSLPDGVIYMDHAATTPLDPRVFERMRPYFSEFFGNPSSIYGLGRKSLAALDAAHETVARLLNCRPTEIVFTGGGSEADNLAIKGVAYSPRRRGKHIITSAIEHHAVLQHLRAARARGLQRHLSAGGWRRAGQSRRCRGGDHRRDRAGDDHVRQQRGGHDAADRRDRRASAASGASRSTWTRCRRRAAAIWMSRRSRSIC